jgi:antitoxin FitA
MKQLLLRVDDDLHAELTAQARDAGRSVNALAKDILAIAISSDTASRQDRLKLRLVAVGVVGQHVGKTETAPIPIHNSQLRDKAIDSMHGAGQIIDDILDSERD